MGLILLRYGEIGLKGKNRKFFFRKLRRNVRRCLQAHGVEGKVWQEGQRIYLQTDELQSAVEAVQRVFGLVSLSPVYEVPANPEAIAQEGVMVAQRAGLDEGRTFRVRARRADKSFPLISPEIERQVGEAIVLATGARPDLSKEAQVEIGVEVQPGHALIFGETIAGPGGLPLGSQGRVVALLSSGIDSPVAAWLMMKRGCSVIPVHFTTSQAQTEQVEAIVEALNRHAYGWQLRPIILSHQEALEPVLARLREMRRDPEALVVVKSTVPPGSNADLSSHYPGLSIVSNPEFLRQGSAVADTMQPDRIVVGTNTEEDLARMTALYEPLIFSGVPIIATNPQSSEMIKYAANSLLGIKVAFINEVADLCEQVGADVEDVARGVGLDPRIGPAFLKAGPGFGGSCFPKDTAAFVQVAERMGSPATIVEAAAHANRRRRASLGRRVVEIAGRSPDRLRIAVLGLTFKAGTDDVRESPALDLVAELAGHGAKVSVFDPQASPDAVGDMNGVLVASSAPDAAAGADILVIATEWPEFSDIDFETVSEAMRGTDIVDLRNILDPEPVTAAGLSLHRVGRPSVSPG